MLAVSLILAGILVRFVPHAPNFTPIAAIALFSGAYLNRKSALVVPLLLMALSDVFIGMHNVVAFTWGGFLVTTVIGFSLQKKLTAGRVAGFSILSSLLFFVISNFGVWIMGWYPRTAAGLIQCYVAAIPFLRDFTVSTLVYSAVLFVSYELIAAAVRGKPAACVLLKKF